MCNARLVDPSTLGHNHLQEGVEVLMFGPPHLLPNPDCVGDIIRIHRLTVCPRMAMLFDIGDVIFYSSVQHEGPCLCIANEKQVDHRRQPRQLSSSFSLHTQVQEYKERPQLVATVGPKKRCQFCLFSGSEEEVIPSTGFTERHHHIFCSSYLCWQILAILELKISI